MDLSAILTRREYQVAELLAWGGCKKDIAQRLYISVRTVENTTKNIYAKTGVTKVNELSAWYFCKHYKISISLSPIHRSIVAMGLLLIMLPCELQSQNTLFLRSAKRVEIIRASRSRRRQEEDSYYL